MTLDQIREAVVQGWCSPANSHKEMDSELAIGIADSVFAAQAQAADHIVDANKMAVEPDILRGGNGEAEPVLATAPSEDSYSEPPHPTQPVATMWREKNTKLYPGIVFDLTDAGKSLPLGVRHQLYTSPPDHRAIMRAALEALTGENIDNFEQYEAWNIRRVAVIAAIKESLK